MVDKGMSRLIPNQVHQAHRPFASSGWEVAAVAYIVAIWLSVIGSLILGFSISFHAGVEGLFLGSPLLFIGAPLTIVVLTLVARLHGPQANELGRRLMDIALTLFFLLGVLSTVIGVIGFFAAFGDTGFGPVVDDMFSHLADIALGAVAIVWSLGEIGALGNLPPAAPVAVDSARMGDTIMPTGPVETSPYSPPPTATFPATPPSPPFPPSST